MPSAAKKLAIVHNDEPAQAPDQESLHETVRETVTVEETDEIVIKRYYNVGIAVAAPQGLIVPNIKGADTIR